MPIYEYQCEKCGHRLEMIQKVSDKLLKKCPKCSQNGLKRCISLTSFRLKGKGWYETDFKDKKSLLLAAETRALGSPEGSNAMLPSGRRSRGFPAQAKSIKETISAACGRVVERK